MIANAWTAVLGMRLTIGVMAMLGNAAVLTTNLLVMVLDLLEEVIRAALGNRRRIFVEAAHIAVHRFVLSEPVNVNKDVFGIEDFVLKV